MPPVIDRTQDADAALLLRLGSSQPGDALERLYDRFEALMTGVIVREALDALSPSHREVLELGYDADLTQASIAERLGVPLGTIKSRMHHALRALRAALEERGIDA